MRSSFSPYHKIKVQEMIESYNDAQKAKESSLRLDEVMKFISVTDVCKIVGEYENYDETAVEFIV